MRRSSLLIAAVGAAVACARPRVAVAPLGAAVVAGRDTVALGRPAPGPRAALVPDPRVSGGYRLPGAPPPGFRELAFMGRDTVRAIVLRHPARVRLRAAAAAYRRRYGPPAEAEPGMVVWCTPTVRLQVVDWGAGSGAPDVRAVLIDRAAVGLGCGPPPA